MNFYDESTDKISQLYLNYINFIYILHIIKSPFSSSSMCPSLLPINPGLLLQQEQHYEYGTTYAVVLNNESDTGTCSHNMVKYPYSIAYRNQYSFLQHHLWNLFTHCLVLLFPKIILRPLRFYSMKFMS